MVGMLVVLLMMLIMAGWRLDGWEEDFYWIMGLIMTMILRWAMFWWILSGFWGWQWFFRLQLVMMTLMAIITTIWSGLHYIPKHSALDYDNGRWKDHRSIQWQGRKNSGNISSVQSTKSETLCAFGQVDPTMWTLKCLVSTVGKCTITNISTTKSWTR